MQRVLVVGGAGVVGSHLVDRLVLAGDEVIVIDDFTRGSYASVAHLKRHPQVALVEHDVRSPFRAVVGQVFHLAVPSTRLGCEPDPVKALVTCVVGTLHALSTASENGARLVIGTSTEGWGEGVRCAEALAGEYVKSHGIDVRFVRMPCTYGPRMPLDGDHLVTRLVMSVLRGERAGPSWRPERRVRLAYVDDVVDALIGTMEAPDVAGAGVAGAGAGAGTAVVAPSREVTVEELSRVVAEAEGRIEPAVAEGSADGAVSLVDGIGRTVEWFETCLGLRDPRAGVCDPQRRTSGIYVRARAEEERRPTALSTANR